MIQKSVQEVSTPILVVVVLGFVFFFYFAPISKLVSIQSSNLINGAICVKLENRLDSIFVFLTIFPLSKNKC